jgi:hypothetical protein
MRLVVGPNQEMAARQLTVKVAATQTSNANTDHAGFVQPLVEPLIPSNRWYPVLPTRWRRRSTVLTATSTGPRGRRSTIVTV